MSQVVSELAMTADRIVCLTARHDCLLEAVNARQVVLERPPQIAGEDAVVLASGHYLPLVKTACQTLRPVYLYERLCAGESTGAELSQVLRIPYIVDYTGTDAMLREALHGAPPLYGELYAMADELAVRQATVIIVGSTQLKSVLSSRGIDAARILVMSGDTGLGHQLAAFIDAQARPTHQTATLQTADSYKDQIQKQWNQNPVGSEHARQLPPHTLEWFLELERHRYTVYAPWMPTLMEFADHRGRDVLEIGGGTGTDLAQFAAHGAAVTDLDLSAGHLDLAEENFRLRGLQGRFMHHDAEGLPFEDNSFDVVYSNGVLHHTPNTVRVISEIARVLRPSGRVIVMVYAENSFHYWRRLIWLFGIKEGLLDQCSMGEIMSRTVERSTNDARPLVKVYTKRRLRALFKGFADIHIRQRQMLAEELPDLLKWTRPISERLLGWNLIIKAMKPASPK
jgi:ubiquinone/menaquinone biosynthesis C-methylase UbiE